jgi:hypothetical protein
LITDCSVSFFHVTNAISEDIIIWVISSGYFFPVWLGIIATVIAFVTAVACNFTKLPNKTTK